MPAGCASRGQAVTGRRAAALGPAGSAQRDATHPGGLASASAQLLRRGGGVGRAPAAPHKPGDCLASAPSLSGPHRKRLQSGWLLPAGHPQRRATNFQVGRLSKACVNVGSAA